MDAISVDVIQASLVRVAVVVLMVSLGLRVPASAIVAAARHGRAFVLTVFLALVVVPVVAWATVRVLGLPEPVAVGILLIAAAPGGSLGLKLVDLARGDVALGLGLFFGLALIAPFSVPITAAVLVGTGSSGLAVDAVPLIVTLLAIQVVPLAVALVVARVAPRPARRIGQLATTATTILLVALIAVALVINLDETLAIGPLGVVAYLVIIATALVGGLVLARDRPGVEPAVGPAVGFLSAQRSASLALLIATSMNVPAVTGAVVAGGLILLVVNPVVARLLAVRRPEPLTNRPEVARIG